MIRNLDTPLLLIAQPDREPQLMPARLETSVVPFHIDRRAAHCKAVTFWLEYGEPNATFHVAIPSKFYLN